MNKQLISNYTQKLNVLVSSQSVKSLRETSASTDRQRIKTSGRQNKQQLKIQYDDIDQSTQSYQQAISKERPQSVNQRQRIVIESPNSKSTKSTQSKENNFYIKWNLVDLKGNQQNSKLSLTSKNTSQNILINHNMSSIHSKSNKYEKPIQRIFQQIQQSQIANQSYIQKGDYLNEEQQKDSFIFINESSNTKENKISKNDQLLSNKYSYVLQNSQLFKRQAQIKQTLPVKFQNLYEINVIDIEDIKQQFPANQNDMLTLSHQTIQNNFPTQINILSDKNLSSEVQSAAQNQKNGEQFNIKKTDISNQGKSLFQRHNQQIMQGSNHIQTQQNVKSEQQKLINHTQDNNNSSIIINSEQFIDKLSDKSNKTNYLLHHQLSLRNLNDGESPTKRNQEKRRQTFQPNIKSVHQNQEALYQKSECLSLHQNPLIQQEQTKQNQVISQQNTVTSQNQQNVPIKQDYNNCGYDDLALPKYQQARQKLEFCLLDIIEKLEKEVVHELDNNQFQKKYFIKISEILNERVSSILIRMNEMLGEGNNINQFVQYLNSFFNYIFTLATEQMDICVKKKVEEECQNYIEEISFLKKSINNKINNQIVSDRKIQKLEEEINHLKNALNDEKNRLQLQVNMLEERIEEMTDLDKAQEKYDEMRGKIQEMQMFIKSLQQDNRSTKQTLEDNLCSLGHSLMVRAKDSIEYQETIRQQFNFFRIKDQTLHSILNDHPFLSAFVYNRTIQSTNIEITEEYMLHRLKLFFKNLKTEDLFDKNAAEAFMEYILSVSKIQYEAFQEIEQIIRYILQIEEKPLSIFFQKLFGIAGFQMPSQLALNEILQINKELNQTHINDLEDFVSYNQEVDLMISAIVSNQNVAIDYRNYFNNNQKQQKCQLLSHLLQSITVQEEIEKNDQIYNQLTVSSSETIQTFETKLSFKYIKELASNLKIKPFTLLNYIIQTYDRYSKERKKDQNTKQTTFQLNSNFIPKVMCDCYKNLKKFQLMYYVDSDKISKLSQQHLSQSKSPSTLIYIDSILEEEQNLQDMRRQSPQKVLQAKKRQVERKKTLISNMKKIKNSLMLINVASNQKGKGNLLKVGQSPSQNQLDSSLSSRQSQHQQSPKSIKK
ncbi:SET domain protein (macronuclear) [Tetrahymena thermophila SB210]|uniref:SET domain protein n=1 Tax=Tetrahymena thermophila (strain SB210) TaxID=312017 RepID=Q22KD9_TETTS|nr:SET domain protein [Tetrahymena thermophila SB210]EAR85860.2 SET domain protein [Tetrahymena thermophila SB210]|eukprot:XP_001033523.2 SET domain protein [Tetrahymena thermophila SB210]